MFGPFAEYENADENQLRHLSWFIFWNWNWIWNPVTFMFGMKMLMKNNLDSCPGAFSKSETECDIQ